ncbi:MAG: O-antigen ligase family protein [Clostridia bacterium]|nr:O-antigen ligase family protein [Clostridia bacterium]
MNTQLVKQNKKTKKFSIKSFINNKKMEKLTFWIMFNIFYILVGSYLSTKYIISHLMFAEGFIPLLIVNIIIGIVICKKGYLKKNIVYVFMLLAIVFAVISTIFAIKPEIALFGEQFRNEGLISIIYYFSLMFLCSFVKGRYKKTIIFFIFIVGIINCIYAIFEAFGEPNVIKVTHPSGAPESTVILVYTWARGFLINPNFLGTYMLLCLSYTIGLFLDEKNKKSSIVYIALSMFFMYGLLISNTLSVLVGLFFVVLFSLAYIIKYKKYKRFAILIVALLSIFIVVHMQGKTSLFKDLTRTGNETVEITKGNAKDEYGTRRLYIWRNTLKILPQNLLHGVGIDNFCYAFGDEPLYSPGRNMFYDKTHNEYLQILITEGIFCLIVYLFMYAVISFRGIKQGFKNKQIYLILPIIGYLAQAFFNISVIEVAPMFFMAMGLCMSSQINENNKLENKKD